jgi:PAS domain S-box-containing protein
MKGHDMKHLVILFLISAAAVAAAPTNAPLKLGVLAYRPRPQVQAQWEPVAVYLQSALGQPVELALYDYPELDAAVERRAVDVVATTATHLIKLQHAGGLSSPLATLVTREGTNQLSVYGGVIIARADRADVASLADLAGRRIATASTDAFGGYRMQLFELLEAGLPLPEPGRMLITGQPHDRVVEAVLDGRADAGFIRAGVLESLTMEGRLDPTRLKIINRRNLPSFPFEVSTRLYPEWPVAALPQVDRQLAGRLAAALYLMPADRFEDSETGIAGFTIAPSYSVVEDVLRRLRLPPFDRAPEITFSDLWRRYHSWIVAIAALLLLLSLAISALVLLYRRSQQSLHERQRAEAALQESETKFRIVADNTYDWEFWQKPDGQFIYTSPSCKRITGHEAKDFMNGAHLFRQIIYPDDRDRYDRHLADSIEKRNPSALEYRLVRLDGAIVWIDHVCQPVFDPAGNYLGRRGSNRDITARRQAEEALQKLNEELEARVTSRTNELEKKNKDLEQILKAFVGRELRMVELKERLKASDAESDTNKNSPT